MLDYTKLGDIGSDYFNITVLGGFGGNVRRNNFKVAEYFRSNFQLYESEFRSGTFIVSRTD